MLRCGLCNVDVQDTAGWDAHARTPAHLARARDPFVLAAARLANELDVLAPGAYVDTVQELRAIVQEGGRHAGAESQVAAA